MNLLADESLDRQAVERLRQDGQGQSKLEGLRFLSPHA